MSPAPPPLGAPRGAAPAHLWVLVACVLGCLAFGLGPRAGREGASLAAPAGGARATGTRTGTGPTLPTSPTPAPAAEAALDAPGPPAGAAAGRDDGPRSPDLP